MLKELKSSSRINPSISHDTIELKERLENTQKEKRNKVERVSLDKEVLHIQFIF